MATYSYSGTKITGMSTTGKVFKNTKIKNAKKGQTYFNKSTGHVYKCTDGGTASKAKWKYLRTDIAKKPTVSVSSLGAPERVTVGAATRCMKATWKTPSAMIDTKKGDRATALDIHWYLGIAGKDPDKVVKTANEKATESTINLSNLTIGKKTYTREEFYPFTGKPKLDYVTIKVVSRNGKGAGASAKATRNFGFPRKPEISDFTFDSENGQLSCTITTDAGADYYERYDTRYIMTAYYSETDSTTTVYDSSSTNTSIPLEFDDVSYASRPYGEFVKVTVQAWARGYKGDSTPSESVFYIAYPAKATIEDVSISGKSSSDKCTVYVDTHSTDEHPVDRVKLEYLANSIYAEANEIPADAGWDTTDIMDDAECEALAMSVADLIPDRGKYTWIRLKTYHANEAVLFRYSDYKRIKDLETPAATSDDDKIVIASAVAGADGKSAVVNLGWDDGALPSTGTEISWDVEEDAWKSTKNPSDYEFTWEDKTAQGAAIPITVGGVTYPHSATITIKDLEEGEKYFVKARRYLEGDSTTYSEYSNSATVVTSEKPESVGAIANRYVPKGSGLNVYWTFSGNGLQKKWQIIDSNGTVLASGENSIGSTQIDAETLKAKAVNNNITFTVQVSTGSGWVVSESHTVTLIDKPTITVNAPSVMSSQPYSFTVNASVQSDLIVIVTSQGAVGQFPQGILRQTAGDTIYSNVFTPRWVASTGNRVATTIQLPSQLDFWDLGSYTISVVAVDRQTGLKSAESLSNFSVLWSHQAPSIQPTETYSLSQDTEVSDNKNYYTHNSTTQTYTVVETEGTENPSVEGWYEVSITEYVTVTPRDYTDENGTHHLAAEINLTPPPNYDSDDVYDIYRVTGDGAQLIGQGFPLTYTAVDEYAPFGEDLTSYYRIAIRTSDGDVSFADVEYVLEYDGIRLDWSGGYIEYPYSVSIGDSYQKDVDIRHHMDGSINGYWNQGVERKGSLNTDAIKILQQEDIDLTRQLARYTGAVFVRTREGTAFEADVQITDLSTKNIAVMSIAIDATEIELTDEFMLPVPFRLEDEGE